MTDRPSILAAECDRIDASAAKLLHIGLQLAEGGRRGIDASLLEQILGIPDATRLHSDWNTIDLAVIDLDSSAEDICFLTVSLILSVRSMVCPASIMSLVLAPPRVMYTSGPEAGSA